MADEEVGARLSLKGRKEFSDDADKAARSVKKIGDEADKTNRAGKLMGDGLGAGGRAMGALGSIATVGAVGLAAATTGIIAFGVQGFNSLKRIEVIAAQTDAAILSTGGAANVTRSQIDGMAGSLEGLTGIEAESITEGQNLLLTFTKVSNQAGEGNDIFDRATASMVDMGVALGTDASGAALQLGKALNDPIKGVGALSRAGVSFTQEQKDQIKAMQASGDMLGAQKIILGELETQFGGSAEAYGNTTEGLIERSKHLFGTLQEGIVNEFTPGVGGGMQVVHDKLKGLVDSMDVWLPKLGDKVRGVKDAFVDMRDTWNDGGSYGETIVALTGISSVEDPINRVASAAGEMFRAFQSDGLVGVAGKFDSMLGTGDLLASTVETLASMFESAGTIVRELFLPVLAEVQEIIPKGVRPLEIFERVLGMVADNAVRLRPVLVGLVAGFVAYKIATLAINAATAAYNAITFIRTAATGGLAAAQAGATASTGSLAAGTGLLNTVMAMNPILLVVIALTALIAGLIYAYKHSETFRNIVNEAFTTVKNVAVTVFDTVLGAIKGVWNWVSDNWPLLLAILTGPIGWAVFFIAKHWESIKTGVTTVKDWIVEKFDAVVTFFTELPGRMATAASGLFDGIKTAFRSAVNWIIDKWNGLSFSLPSIDTGIPGIGEIGGFSLSTPNIPRLHSGGTTTSGGVVNMKPGEELIMLPPAASVVPMSDNVKSMASSLTNGGSEQPIVLQVVLDRKVIAEAVYDHAGDQVARR